MQQRIAKARAQRGFTLIEVLVVVAIIGILTGIAYPTYRDYIFRGHRSQAKAVLVSLANNAERYYRMHNRYGNPTQMNRVGLTDERAKVAGRYRLRWDRISVDTYRYHFTAIGDQRRDSDCPYLIIDQNTLASATGIGEESLCSSSL